MLVAAARQKHQDEAKTGREAQRSLLFKFWVQGFRVQGLGFRVKGFGVEGGSGNLDQLLCTLTEEKQSRYCTCIATY